MRSNGNTDSESLLQDLMATPVGRRWLLKAGLGSAPAIAAASLPSLSRSAGARPPSTAARARVAGQPGRRLSRPTPSFSARTPSSLATRPWASPEQCRGHDAGRRRRRPLAWRCHAAGDRRDRGHHAGRRRRRVEAKRPVLYPGHAGRREHHHAATRPASRYARPPFLLFDAMVGKHRSSATTSCSNRTTRLTATSCGWSTWTPTPAPSRGTRPCPRQVHAASVCRRAALVGPRRDRTHRQRPRGHGPAGRDRRGARRHGLLQQRAGHADWPVAVANRRGGDQSWRGADPRGRRRAAVGLRPQRQPDQVLRIRLELNTGLHWPRSGTYLDMAVDGASHIYLLYYTGDGSQPGDYHIDVYNPDGTPLTTNSPGHEHRQTGRRLLAQHLRRQLHGL